MTMPVELRLLNDNVFKTIRIGETGGNCNIFHINAHYAEHVCY